jgi:hypothetical protein
MAAFGLFAVFSWLSFRNEDIRLKHVFLNQCQQNRITENVSNYGRGNIDFGVT